MFILKNPNVFIFTVMLNMMGVHVHIQIPMTYRMCQTIYKIHICRFFVQNLNSHPKKRYKKLSSNKLHRPSLLSPLGSDSSLHTHFLDLTNCTNQKINSRRPLLDPCATARRNPEGTSLRASISKKVYMDLAKKMAKLAKEHHNVVSFAVEHPNFMSSPKYTTKRWLFDLGY